MLTPAFELTQNEEFLFVSIQVPYAKISEVEVHFDDDAFMFYSKPYYLRLNLPGKVVYQDEPSIKYDIDKRIFTIEAPKAHKGEEFDGLDLVTLLLAPKKGKASAAPLIEVLEGSNDVLECEEFDWSVELKPSEDQFGDIVFSGQQCGFSNSYSFSVFNLEEEVDELFEVTEPQKKAYQTRREERIAKELTLFNEDYYIADLYQDEEIQNLIKLPCQWDAIYENIQNNSSDLPDKINFTHEEKERLRKLPNKEYLLDEDQQKSALLGLIDILFAYAYNKRITEGENTVMSAWTINRLSATFSWLEVFTSVQDVVITCLRRSLVYPLYRHFELSLTVLEDVIKLLKLGRKYVMKCLLEIHELFSENEPRYILNDLYIMDYNVWIQGKRCSSKTLLSLAQALEKVLLTKGDIGLSLVNIESFAAVAWMSRESSLLSNSPKTKRKQSRSISENSAGQSQNTNESTLCSHIENLSLSQNSVDSDENEDTCSQKSSDWECCSSSTSDSSDSDSSTSDSDSNQGSDDNWESSSSKTDSDGDADTSDWDNNSNGDTDSDDNARSCLLKKVTSGERIL